MYHAEVYSVFFQIFELVKLPEAGWKIETQTAHIQERCDPSYFGNIRSITEYAGKFQHHLV